MPVEVLHPTPSFLEHGAPFTTVHRILNVLRGHPCYQEKMDFCVDSAVLNLCAQTVVQTNIEHEDFMMLVQPSRSQIVTIESHQTSQKTQLLATILIHEMQCMCKPSILNR